MYKSGTSFFISTILLAIVIILGAMLLLQSCGTIPNEPDAAVTEFANFKTIEGKEYLSYDIDTKVVYYMFSTKDWAGYQGYGYTYFAPYVNGNGKFCKYVNDEIVEITDKVSVPVTNG